ncbi:MAG: glycosyl hydrolase [Candidatus Sumerlaeaceae bacterium]|nr:glycosyl hydrolase [Candidatus Sumerlaeaceae bacterium]
MKRIIVGMWLAAVAAGGAHGGAVVRVSDFEGGVPGRVTASQDKRVSNVKISEARNTLDGSRALRYRALMSGPEAGWAGISVPVSDEAATTGVDHVVLDVCGGAASRDVYLTLTEKDGARWNANLRLTPEWRRVKVALYEFVWFMGPDARKATHPRPENVKSVDLWLGNRFPGENGFEVDNIALTDEVPAFVLQATEPPLVPVQRPLTLTVEARATTGGASVAADTDLWIAVRDRNDIEAPRVVAMRSGRAQFDVFPRRVGRLDVFVFDPITRQQVVVPVVARQGGLRVDFRFEGEEASQQVVYAHRPMRPLLRLEGETSIPLSAHIEVTDHRGRRVAALNSSVADLTGRLTTVTIPCAGLMQVGIKLLAEPVSALPRAERNAPEYLTADPVAAERAAATVAVPDGVTTDIVVGSLVRLENLPSTATVLGEDRFTVWALADSPRENVLYSSPFGICSAALFHLSPTEMDDVGLKRLRWHRLLGSRWGRNDFWWHEIETSPTVYNWAKADKVHQMYRTAGIKPVAVLAYEAAWSPGVSPATDEQRGLWRDWVAALTSRYRVGIPVHEVWNEPNHGFWKPAADVKAYRELVRVTYEGVKSVMPEPRIMAGALAGYDPVFMDGVLSDGYANYVEAVSFHPYPLRHSEGPEENNLPEACRGMRDLMRKYDMIAAGKELWITEIGWATRPGGATEEQQAAWLVQTYAIALQERLTKVFWFNLYDWKLLPWEGEWDSHLGLVDSTYRPKPSAVAYNLTQYMLAQTEPLGVSRQGKAVIHSFAIRKHSLKWPGKMHVAWTPRQGDTETIDLTMEAGGVFAADYLGAEQKGELVGSVSSADGPTTRTFRFAVTHEPLFIWDAGLPPSGESATQP